MTMADLIDNERFNLLRVAREVTDEMYEIDRIIDSLFIMRPTGEMTVLAVVERAHAIRNEREGRDNVVQFTPRGLLRSEPPLPAS